MATLNNLQKRKRADTVLNKAVLEDDSDTEEMIVVHDPRFGLPSNMEDNSDESDVDQPDSQDVTQSTLFWSTQRVISREEDGQIGLAKPATKHQDKGLPALVRKSIINYIIKYKF